MEINTFFTFGYFFIMKPENLKNIVFQLNYSAGLCAS